MTVVDPIFPSLWDATLFELGAETAVWEVFADAPNFFHGAPGDVQADEAERVLRRIRKEGWAQVARRRGDEQDFAAAHLSDEEAEAVIRRARTWFLTEREPSREVPEELLPFFLAPMEKWLQSDRGRE